MPKLVRYAVDRSIATLTLDSPHNRNALSGPLVGQARAHLQAAADDVGVRAVVLTHTGGTFCAGVDLKRQSTEGDVTGPMLELLRDILQLPKPVIACLNGHVRAGGLGLVGACDIAIAGPASTFAFTEVRLGLAPAIISLTTLGRMSERTASRYFLTGETFDANTAVGTGLITAAVTDAEAELSTICDALRACSPQGLTETKPLTTRTALAAFDARADEVRTLSQRLFETDEAHEGISAFQHRRPPRWAEPD